MRATIQAALLSTAFALTLTACAIRDVRNGQNATIDETRTQLANAPTSRAVVQMHAGAWLMGDQITASKPQPAVYDKAVSYTYPAGSLAEIAQWITRTTHIPVQIDSSVNDTAPRSTGSAATAALPPLPPGIPGLPSVPGGLFPVGSASTPSTSIVTGGTPQMLTYRGTFKGFLDQQDSRFNVWDRYQDGVITFYRTETRVFPLPGLNEATAMAGQITTGSSDSGSGSSGSTGTSSSGSTGSSGSSGSGDSSQTLSQSAEINPWKQLQQTAQAVSGGGAVVADLYLGVLTVPAHVINSLPPNGLQEGGRTGSRPYLTLSRRRRPLSRGRSPPGFQRGAAPLGTDM